MTKNATNKHMKKCLCASRNAAWYEPVLYRGEYDRLFAFAKNLGFDGVEIHLRSAKDIDPMELLCHAQTTGMDIAAIATGLAKRIDGLTLIAPSHTERNAAIKRLKDMIDLASLFGSHVIIGSLRGNIPTNEQKSVIEKRLLEAMLEVAAYIENKNCDIVFEAINRYENNYLNTAEETLEFISRINSTKVKLLLDTFHMNIEEQDICQAIKKSGNLLGHVHLADNTRHYPGHGMIDFKSILKTLAEINYDGWLGFEYLPIPDEETAAKRGYATISKILSQI